MLVSTPLASSVISRNNCNIVKGSRIQCGIADGEFSNQLFEEYLLDLQARICQQMTVVDGCGKHFLYDKWQRGNDASLGYGITRVIEDGGLLERGAVNISIIQGHLTQKRAEAMSARGRGTKPGTPYFAGALSIVFHPRNPYVPTFRSDIRYFQVEDQRGWFGGGADLTPYYLFKEDTKSFHMYYKKICDKYDEALYDFCKAACDSYFYLPNRQEHRGTGGIFFDDMEDVNKFVRLNSRNEELCTEENRRNLTFQFVKEVAEGFLSSFVPIAQRRREMAYGDKERDWQLLRRGRYIEFNLIYDRGVKFGLEGGRIESIMMSAPPLVAWKYNMFPEEGSAEAELLNVLKDPCDWIHS